MSGDKVKGFRRDLRQLSYSDHDDFAKWLAALEMPEWMKVHSFVTRSVRDTFSLGDKVRLRVNYHGIKSGTTGFVSQIDPWPLVKLDRPIFSDHELTLNFDLLLALEKI